MMARTWMALLLSAAIGGTAAQPGGQSREMGGDRFAAGGTVRVERAVGGDLIAAGGHVDVGAEINGDAILTGGDVRVAGRVGKSVYAAGGHLTLVGDIADNVRAAGGEVVVGSGARIGGNASFAAGRVQFDGDADGYVQAAGGELLINGTVDGDVAATGGRVEVGPNARIGGRLRVATRDEPVIHPSAQIAGGVERVGWRGAGSLPTDATARRVGRGLGWIWTIGLMLLAAVLVAIAPAAFARVAATVRSRIGWSAIVGFIALVCIPVAAILLMITLIGLPLGIAALFAYLALLPVGYVTTAIAASDWALDKGRPAALQSTALRALAAMAAVLVLGLLARLPVVGGLIVLAALLIGIGALMLQLRRPARAA